MDFMPDYERFIILKTLQYLKRNDVKMDCLNDAEDIRHLEQDIYLEIQKKKKFHIDKMDRYLKKLKDEKKANV